MTPNNIIIIKRANKVSLTSPFVMTGHVCKGYRLFLTFFYFILGMFRQRYFCFVLLRRLTVVNWYLYGHIL